MRQRYFSVSKLEFIPARPGWNTGFSYAAQLARRDPGCRAACVTSAVGSLSRAVLRYAAEPQGTVRDEPLEFVTLSGILRSDGMHLHACVADARGNLSGGLAMPGYTVRTAAEIVLAQLPPGGLQPRV